MLTEETKIDKVEILEDGQIQVREATVIYRDGVEISRTFYRYVLDPGVNTLADVASKAADKPGVSLNAIATALWNTQTVAARQTFLAAAAAALERP